MSMDSHLQLLLLPVTPVSDGSKGNCLSGISEVAAEALGYGATWGMVGLREP